MTDDRPYKLPETMPLPAQIDHLQRHVRSLMNRIEKLEAGKPEETPEEKREREQEERDARRARSAQLRAEAAQAELASARAQAIRAIAKLVPQATKQARLGKPALMRMILRATR